ncbi:hypothetical protein JIN85_07760 [Luteolibacter pohnpeiensis]|uniref:Uncharacterized protein n=1 Tax=Luteolibacter pohnpeiensis TaxID=454153 RepID=A0A934VVL4_9BACT|nr:hypothetical protein [Luteolibacter pohnpeiensis]MBK1882305.1 hypothetical protein [Luteolibacter pohnpeiensis]
MDEAFGWGKNVEVPTLFNSSSSSFPSSPSHPSYPRPPIHTRQPSLPNTLLSQFVSAFLAIGLVSLSLPIVSGKKSGLKFICPNVSHFFKSILVLYPFYLLVDIAYSLVNPLILVLPILIITITLMVRYGYFIHAIIDRDMNPLEALKYSAKITTNNRLNLFVLWMASIGILILGAIALCVGVLFAIPMLFIMSSVAYRWMQYGHRAAMDHPGTEIPMLSSIE